MRDRSVPIPYSPTLRVEKSLDDPNKFLAGLDMRVVPGLRDALRPGVREPGIEPVEILLPNAMGTPPVNQESRRIDGRAVRVGEPGEAGEIAPEAAQVDLPAQTPLGSRTRFVRMNWRSPQSGTSSAGARSAVLRSARSSGPSAAIGSSRTSKFGIAQSARPRAIRCRSPPES